MGSLGASVKPLVEEGVDTKNLVNYILPLLKEGNDWAITQKPRI